MNQLKSPKYVWQRPDWPNWRYDEATVLRALVEARQAHGVLMGNAQAVGFHSEAMDKVAQDILVGEVIATAAIEGQKLDLDQVRSSVMRKLGKGFGGYSARHVDGLVDVLDDAIRNRGVALDAERLCRWQSALFPQGTSSVFRIQVGEFRTHEDPMQIISGREGRTTVHYEAPPSARVPAEMQRLLDWINGTQDLDGIIKASIAHVWFETIHPFEDGNGRVGRAIMDRIIAQHDNNDLHLYSLSGQLSHNRNEYYNALNVAQTGDLDLTEWITWFARQFAAACKKSTQHIATAIDKSRFWSDHQHDDLNERQRKTLVKLLDAGDGGFEGGLTADKYTRITGASKPTATRDLADLVDKRALIRKGEGKATRYYVNVPGWNLKLCGPSSGFLGELGANAAKSDIHSEPAKPGGSR